LGATTNWNNSYLIILTCSTFYFASEEGWKCREGFYFLVVTASTIGYGDIYPEAVGNRFIAAFYILVAVLSVSRLIGFVVGYVVEQRQSTFFKSMTTHEFNLDDLRRMD